jgi:hypothetical protein
VGATGGRQLLATGGSSIIHGHCAIVLTLPLLFLITVTFIRDSWISAANTVGYCAVQFVETGGSSIIQGHCAIVLTLPVLFLITVIFMGGSYGNDG